MKMNAHSHDASFWQLFHNPWFWLAFLLGIGFALFMIALHSDRSGLLRYPIVDPSAGLA